MKQTQIEQLVIGAHADCKQCNGTGFAINNRHDSVANTIIVRIVVCGCVTVVTE